MRVEGTWESIKALNGSPPGSPGAGGQAAGWVGGLGQLASLRQGLLDMCLCAPSSPGSRTGLLSSYPSRLFPPEVGAILIE